MDSFSLYAGERGERNKGLHSYSITNSEKDLKVKSQIQSYKEFFGNVLYKRQLIG